MPTLQLSDEECQQLMNRLINSDPLLMNIAAQLRAQQAPAEEPSPIKRAGGIKLNADGKEVRP